MEVAGRFGFVEMRTEELATSAMALDKVDLCNRQINVGRPKGYVEPPGGHAPPATLASAQIFAAQLAKAPSRVLLLKNMLKASVLLDEQERQEVRHPPPPTLPSPPLPPLACCFHIPNLWIVTPFVTSLIELI